MIFEIQKILKPLTLRDYAEIYKKKGDPVLQVWVNPPRKLLDERNALDAIYMDMMRRAEKQEEEPDAKKIEKEIDGFVERSHAWYSTLWSQGPEETHCPVEKINELNEEDPALLNWLCTQTRVMLQEHREQQKKT